MYGVSSEVWNLVGEDPQLRTRWAREVFPLPGEAMAARVKQMHGEMKEQGVDATVQVAYLTVMPLLEEHEAITRLVLQDSDLRQALPEVLTVKEAVRLMVMDYWLTPQKQQDLAKLLQTGVDQMWMPPAKAKES